MEMLVEEAVERLPIVGVVVVRPGVFIDVVVELVLGPQSACGAAGTSQTVRATTIIDATGRAGLLARQLGLRRADPQLPNLAVYAHYRGVPRLEERRRGDIRIVARHDAGWFWVIPIADDLTSVGVVLPRPLFDRLEKGRPERCCVASRTAGGGGADGGGDAVAGASEGLLHGATRAAGTAGCWPATWALPRPGVGVSRSRSAA
jgi:hypothetical protein